MAAIRELSLKDLDQLGELLASVPEPYMPMELDMLDGYLTAIAVMKDPPALSDWMVYILDINGNRNAAPANHKDWPKLRKLISERGMQIEECILGGHHLDPVIYEDDDDETLSEDEFAALAPFADGFALACEKWPELINSRNKKIQAALVGILRWESRDDEELNGENAEMLDGIETEMRFADIDEAILDISSCAHEIAEITRKSEIRRSGCERSR